MHIQTSYFVARGEIRAAVEQWHEKREFFRDELLAIHGDDNPAAVQDGLQSYDQVYENSLECLLGLPNEEPDLHVERFDMNWILCVPHDFKGELKFRPMYTPINPPSEPAEPEWVEVPAEVSMSELEGLSEGLREQVVKALAMQREAKQAELEAQQKEYAGAMARYERDTAMQPCPEISKAAFDLQKAAQIRDALVSVDELRDIHAAGRRALGIPSRTPDTPA